MARPLHLPPCLPRPVHGPRAGQSGGGRPSLCSQEPHEAPRVVLGETRWRPAEQGPRRWGDSPPRAVFTATGLRPWHLCTGDVGQCRAPEWRNTALQDVSRGPSHRCAQVWGAEGRGPPRLVSWGTLCLVLTQPPDASHSVPGSPGPYLSASCPLFPQRRLPRALGPWYGSWHPAGAQRAEEAEDGRLHSWEGGEQSVLDPLLWGMWGAWESG